MQRPNILDVVRAVTTVAEDHPEVRVWWYSPDPDFRVKGDDPGKSSLEFVLEFKNGDPTDADVIAEHLSTQLSDNPVSVREHRGKDETVRLFRMLTTD